jgi:putative nucleotidyltransferase with HDIG domain
MDPSEERVMPTRLKALVVVVFACGAALVIHSAVAVGQAAPSGYWVALALLTMVSGRFVIPVPGRAATVSVSEIFLFAIVVLFGPSAATLTVAVDGLWTSLTQKHRRAYRAVFNVAEPAISIWSAGQVFFLVSGHAATWGAWGADLASLLAAASMAATFFAFNSGLTAVALAWESTTSAYETWRRHAPYLAVNYYAAASLATLAVGNGWQINLTVVGLIVPLLLLSYVAYHEASSRMDAAHRHVAETERLYHAATEMLAIAVDAKDQVTHGHIRRVQRHTRAVAEALGISDPAELKAIEAGALLHDIGKLGVPDYVLNKPSALTRAEYDTIKMHAPLGARILQAVDFPYPVVPIVRHHHEQWDGGGYPDGLVGAEIPIGARIIAVVDCFDALTSDRPYRSRLSTDDAVALLRSRKGTFYDPAVVDTFIEMIPVLQHSDAVQGEPSEITGGLVAGLARGGHDRGRVDVEEVAVDRKPPSRVRRYIDERIERLGCAEACLYVLNPAGDVLTVGHATPRLARALEHFRIAVGAGVTGWVAAHRSTIRRADAALDLGELGGRLSLARCVSSPVFVLGELRGALTVYTTDALPDDLVGVVASLAQEIGLLIAHGESNPELPWSTARRSHLAPVTMPQPAAMSR